MHSIPCRVKKVYTDEEKQRHVRSWQQSGLTMSKYSLQTEISLSSLSKWASEQGIQSPLFQPVIPVVEPEKITANIADQPIAINGIELVLPNGILIRIPQLLEVSQAMLWIREIVKCS